MWVVKLGGSLHGSEHLPRWLDEIACYGGGQVVIVPGGGPFADVVRQLDGRWGLPDGAAHRMALRAMEQYADLLTVLRDDLCPAADESGLRAALGRAQVAVWMPLAMVLAHPEVPASWSVTSDSLAAWLAGLLGATGLLLVKSVTPRRASVPVQNLMDQGVVDGAFAEFMRAGPFVTRLVGCSQFGAVRELLYSGVAVGTRVSARSGARTRTWQRPQAAPRLGFEPGDVS